MQTLYHLSTDSRIGNILAEFLYHIVMDVSLQKRLADIAHSIGDVRLGDSASARERLKNRVKFFR